MRISALVFFIVLMTSCQQEESLGLEQEMSMPCLPDYEKEGHWNRCTQGQLPDECNNLYLLGEKDLSEKLKNNFPDFCFEKGDLIEFLNATGDTLFGTIERKNYSNYDESKVHFDQGVLVDCYCLESELAVVEIKSSNFWLSISLNNILLEGIDQSNYKEKIVSGYSFSSNKILGTSNTTGSYLINNIAIENYFEEAILHDTVTTDFNKNIILNDRNFEDVYSNRIKADPKEIIYFNPQIGLIAVRDSLGELWTCKS